MAVDLRRITRVRLRNYRSIESCDVPLASLTVLVGPNGSGKSNFLDALSFIREARRSVREAVRRRGGMRGMGFHGREQVLMGLTFETAERAPFRYEMTIGATHGGPAMCSETLVPTGGEGLGPVELGSVDPAGAVPQSVEEVALPRWKLFSPVPAVLRSPQVADPGGLLEADGFNAPGRFRELPAEKSEAVQSYLRMIVPGLRRVEAVALPEPERLITVRFVVAGRDGDERVLPARAMSDGALRAFALLVALFDSPPGLPIGVERPEAGLHPAAARVLLDAMKEASAERQVIAATHSPDLLDQPTVRAEEIVAVRYLHGRSYVGPPDEVGRAALAEGWYTAGELLRADQLLPEVPLGERSLRLDA